jgi:hypothetical protein
LFVFKKSFGISYFQIYKQTNPVSSQLNSHAILQIFSALYFANALL